MRSVGPVLRVPPTVAGRRRARPTLLTVALALALVTAPAAGIRAAALAPAPADPGYAPAAPPVAAPRLPLAAHLDPPPGQTSLESVRFGGGFPGGPSAQPSISGDGLHVAFASRAPDLVPGDTNNAIDVFVRDRATGTTIRLPQLGGLPVPPNGLATEPSISADGRVVAFTYDGPQVFAAVAVIDPPPVVVAWDRATGATASATVLPPGSLLVRSREASVSGDGQRVAFTADYRLGTTGVQRTDVFVVDRATGTSTLVSANLSGRPGNAPSAAPAISRDGRVVAFQSDASDLVPDDQNGETDVFARDLAAATTDLVSIAPNSDGPSEAPAISADGRFVAFESTASTLAPGNLPDTHDVFLRDRVAGATSLVSIALDGGPVTGDSGQSAISDDGRVVAFASTGANLVAAAGSATFAQTLEGPSEVFARDVVAGETIRISVALPGGAAGGSNVGPAVGGNGRFVAWSSTSPRLVPGDTNQLGDVFLRDLPPVPLLAPPVIDFGTRATGTTGPPIAATLSNAGWAAMSASGATIDGPAAADFAVLFDGCVGRVLRRTEACTVTVSFTPSASDQRTASLRVPSDAPGSPHSARLVGGGSLAQLELDPPIGQPGIVTIATGSGFPPGSEVVLAWSRGITQRLPPIVADASGGFRVQVLVFHNDIVGARDLVATPADGTSFPAFGAAFRVTEPTGQPPRFVIYTALDNPPPAIIGRR